MPPQTPLQNLGGINALVSTSSPACRVSTPPLDLPILDILTTSTPVGQPFCALTLGLKHKKWDCSPCSTPGGHSSKRTYAGTEEGCVGSGCSTLPIQLIASHSPKHQEPGLVDLPSSSVKAVATPNDRLAAEVSGNDADQGGNGSDSSSDCKTVLSTPVRSQ